MANTYRSVDERRMIIRSVIADTNPPALTNFNLTPSEEVFFRARAAKIVDRLAKQSSSYKSYYALPTQKPFNNVVGVSALVILSCLAIGTYEYFNSSSTPAYPVFAALMSIAAVAAGWTIAGGITHRNTIRQNTNSMIFARFSQAPFGEAMHRFHCEFDKALSGQVTLAAIAKLRSTGCDEDRRKAASVTYLLNYFEFIASGVLRGDLDQEIVRQNLRGVVCFYHDKCEPYIRQSNRQNPLVFEHLIKLRTHYREP